MFTSPAQHIGALGEHFASNWLKKQGYEIRGFWDLRIKLDKENKKPISKDELRIRWTQSLDARILSLEVQLPQLEKIHNPTKTVKDFIEQERPHLTMMKQALEDLKNGRPIEEINEYPDSYSGPRTRGLPTPTEGHTDPETHAFLGNQLHPFLEFMDECSALSREHLGGTMYPDYVGKKENEFYLIEVKTNEAELAPLQRRALELAGKHGFKPKLIRVRVKVEASCEEERFVK